MEDIFLIVIGDEILEWGTHEVAEDVLNAFFWYDARRLGEDYCLRTFDYHAVCGEHDDGPRGQSYDVIQAPFAATSIVESSRSLKAVTSEFLCQKYYRLVRSFRQVENQEYDRDVDDLGSADIQDISYCDLSHDLDYDAGNVKWRSDYYNGTQTKPFLMAAIGSYACFVDSDRTLVH
ncbi:hypothetical protein [Rhizobium sp.]|uniref:hypothetical protein n=1 Tax=Rhizobium sp. TaxID=391 RepID=UPI0028A9FC35